MDEEKDEDGDEDHSQNLLSFSYRISTSKNKKRIKNPSRN